jgi:hypothetical protein
VDTSSSLRISLLRRLLPLGLIPLLVACGGGGSTTSSNAPTISNLRVSYSPTTPVTGQAVQLTFFVDVVDPNGDWVGGTCSFISGNVNVPIQAPGLAANATSGTGQCIVNQIFANTSVEVDLLVLDRANNQSNVLSGLVQVEKPGHS